MIHLWLAEQLHTLARWLEQLGTEPVCNQPHEWPFVNEAFDDYKPVFRQFPGLPEPIDAAGWLTISKAGIGCGGKERGE